MTGKRRQGDPYFVSATVTADGEVEVIDNDGEMFRLWLLPDRAFPHVARRLRAFEGRELTENWLQSQTEPVDVPAPRPPFTPKLVS